MKKILLFALCLGFVVAVASCNNNNQNNGDDDKEWFELDGNYTYNDFIGGTTSMNWNPLSWETNDDSYVLSYLSAGFYDYQLNEDGDGWEVVPEMASALPTDVTAQYVGQYGIAAGEKGKAWSIPLNKDAQWENGEPITAEDYIYSMKQQLDPVQLNRRADSYYGGDFSVVNAKNYLYSTQDGVYETPAVLGYESVQAAIDAGVTVYLDVEYFWGINAKDAETEIADAQKDGALVPVTSTVKIRDYAVEEGAAGDWISAADIFAAYQGYLEVGGDYHTCMQIYVPNQYKGLAFEEVGLIAVDDYTLVIVIENELQNPNFYLPYYLSSTWLINEELYESCWQDTPEGRKNNYMTSKSTSISYGPYTLSYFEADKQITFVRNKNWYGYYDGKHEGQYQTDVISCQVIEEHKTALLAFLNGEIDAVGMDSEDIKTYGGSEYLVYTPESYTTKFTINTKLDTLVARESEGVNKRILTVKEFREAFSLCLDREYFTTAFTAAAAPGYALFNYMYQVINEDGTESTYRNSDAAKQALVNLYGIEYGEGKDYATLDEAYKAITGFDMAKAKEKMQAAYDYAVANGLYTDGEIIKIRFSVYSSDTIYNQMYEYVKAQLNEAVVGTSLEGKIELEMFADADYYNSLYAGNTDVIFSTWGGATYGTLTTMAQIYCDDHEGNGNQMEIGFDTDKYNVTVEVKGQEYTYSIKKWADWLNGTATIEALGKNSDYTVAEKVVILAACEEAYLAEYCAIPLYYRQAASLHSQKINYGTDTYVNLIGFGGLRHITYNYTDEAWETYRAGGLTY